MLTLVGPSQSRSGWQPPPPQPFDETVWQAWLAKGRGQDARSSRTRLEAIKLATVVGLLAASGLWSYLAPYQIVVRFVVCAAAIFVMFHAFHARHYFLTVVFGAVALLYNPVAPVLHLSDDWHRALLATTALPFIASLGWRNLRKSRHE